MNDAIIQTKNLTKVYGSGSTAVRALDNLTLSVKPGEIFGYLGPNGAGKTTTIRMLLDLIRPTEGSVTIFGQDANEHSVELHKRIGFLPGELNLWEGRTGQQVIHYVASVRGNADAQKQEAETLAQRLKFDTSKKVRDYSTGNKRKLGLIIALMHNPELLILDEPTSGLDPLMQQTFNEMMRDVRDSGRTVFLSSHVLSEVQTICDRVGILRDGDLKAVEDVERLTHVEFRHLTFIFRDELSQPERIEQRVRDAANVDDVHAEANRLRLKLYGDFDPLLRAIDDRYIQDIRVEEPSLEEIFLRFYGDESDKNTRRADNAESGRQAHVDKQERKQAKETI